MKNLRPIPYVFSLQPFVKTVFGFDRDTLVWKTASKTTEMYPPMSHKHYTTEDQNTIKLGDTLILGNPTSQELIPRTTRFGDDDKGGVENTRSTDPKNL